MADRRDTAGKALRINLSRERYGTFAEIGGGQEVSRWFFRVGGAAGTVAKTMSAYDMTVGDAIYGKSARYVSRERLAAMLEREYELLVRRLAAARGKETAFFVFADTVATRSYKGDNECHGWLGLRFQPRPGNRPSDIIAHIALRDSTAQRQQEALGVLGVNLLHAAFYERSSRRALLSDLLGGLSLDQIEIDVLELLGPAFARWNDTAAVAADLVSLGLARAVVMDERGELDQPSSILRKRPLLLYRARTGAEDPAAARVLRASVRRVAAAQATDSRPPLPIVEVALSAQGSPSFSAGAPSNAALAVAALRRPGRATLVTALDHAYLVTDFLRRSNDGPLHLLIGLDGAVHALWQGSYRHVSAGMLEALGRLLKPGTRIDVYGMPRREFARRLAAHGITRGFCSAPDKPALTLADLRLASPAGRLLEYLVEAGWIADASAAARPSARGSRRSTHED